jgi:hypothetical protein
VRCWQWNARNRGTWHCKGREKVVVRGIIKEASTSLKPKNCHNTTHIIVLRPIIKKLSRNSDLKMVTMQRIKSCYVVL